MKKTVRLSGIAYESLVNGPGMRRVFFSQGCKHNCKGCFNPDTHDFNGGEERNIQDLIEDVRNNPFIEGITFSGGDPLERAEEFGYMAKEFKAMGLNIWVYTGYTFEELLSEPKYQELLKNIDVLVDGEFKEEQKGEYKYRGSANQRIIDAKKSLRRKKVITIDL